MLHIASNKKLLIRVEAIAIRVEAIATSNKKLLGWFRACLACRCHSRRNSNHIRSEPCSPPTGAYLQTKLILSTFGHSFNIKVLRRLGLAYHQVPPRCTCHVKQCKTSSIPLNFVWNCFSSLLHWLDPCVNCLALQAQ